MKASLYIFVLLAFVLTSCDKEESWDCFKKSGKDVSEFRHPGFFDSIKAVGRMDIVYRFAETPFVEVVFGKNVIADITTKCENGILTIENETKCNFVRNQSKRPHIVIYGTEFRHFENQISGDLFFEDTLKSDDFKYEQWDSNGKIDLTVDSDVLSVFAHTGYAEISLHGKTNHAELYSGSVCTYDASDLIAQSVHINNSSTYDMNCFANNYIYATIISSGNIIYGGSPNLIQTEIEGSGHVIPR